MKERCHISRWLHDVLCYLFVWSELFVWVAYDERLAAQPRLEMISLCPAPFQPCGGDTFPSLTSSRQGVFVDAIQQS